MHGTGNYVSLSGAPETCMTGRYVCVSLMCVRARASASPRKMKPMYIRTVIFQEALFSSYGVICSHGRLLYTTGDSQI